MEFRGKLKEKIHENDLFFITYDFAKSVVLEDILLLQCIRKRRFASLELDRSI